MRSEHSVMPSLWTSALVLGNISHRGHVSSSLREGTSPWHRPGEIWLEYLPGWWNDHGQTCTQVRRLSLHDQAQVLKTRTGSKPPKGRGFICSWPALCSWGAWGHSSGHQLLLTIPPDTSLPSPRAFSNPPSADSACPAPHLSIWVTGVSSPACEKGYRARGWAGKPGMQSDPEMGPRTPGWKGVRHFQLSPFSLSPTAGKASRCFPNHWGFLVTKILVLSPLKNYHSRKRVHRSK